MRKGWIWIPGTLSYFFGATKLESTEMINPRIALPHRAGELGESAPSSGPNQGARSGPPEGGSLFLCIRHGTDDPILATCKPPRFNLLLVCFGIANNSPFSSTAF
jgi:hypothetical protein